MDGRAADDQDAATVMDTIEADTDEEAITEMADVWDGSEVVLINSETEQIVRYQEA